MAIIKAVNPGKGGMTHAAMHNCIGYVMSPGKHEHRDDLVFVTGQYDRDRISPDDVYREFKEQKEFWDKDSGRMYAHYVCSWHKDEDITPETAMEFGKEWAERVFPDHQVLVTVHVDRDHVHCHFVVNTVSYLDGSKLHMSANDLASAKETCNSMCLEYGLSIAQKGKHFDGSEISQGTITSWSKDKYHLLCEESKTSYLADCGVAIIKSLESCSSKEQFVESMESQGWYVKWNHRKHVTYVNENGDRVRDTNIEKTFHLPAGKEGLTDEFERQAAKERELESYCRQIEDTLGGDVAGAGGDEEGEGQSDCERQGGRPEPDIGHEKQGRRIKM